MSIRECGCNVEHVCKIGSFYLSTFAPFIKCFFELLSTLVNLIHFFRTYSILSRESAKCAEHAHEAQFILLEHAHEEENVSFVSMLVSLLEGVLK